ncbi:MAG: gliding motility protein GldN [Crocinitomicaceae bacterium]|nr:gliding motility protein GldN [Crocinitomicaceae bacterium]
MRKIILMIIGLSTTMVYAQGFEQLPGPPNVNEAGIVDGPWLNTNIITKRTIAYEGVREADAIWSKRVWRSIDLREKINHPLYYPLDEVTPYEWQRNGSRWSLWTIMRKHILNGDLRVFSPFNPVSYGLGNWDGDQLKYPINAPAGSNFYNDDTFRDDLLYYVARLGPPSDIPKVDVYGDPLVQIDPLTGDSSYVYQPRDTIWYNSRDIVEYRLKEDWFFDKERSCMDVRIIAIAPVVYKIEMDANGIETIAGKKELFWLYFPHCRYVFNNYVMYNDRNSSQWMSIDDLFWKRRFSSYVYKESNVYDRSIDNYKHGVEALRESELITNEIRSIEHDLWSF